MLTIRNYVRAKSLEEAYELNQTKTNRILGGMMWLRMMHVNVGTVIDLCDLGLNTIEESAEEFTLGAMVTLRQLEMSQSLNAYTHGAVAKAVRDIVGVQFRNSSTLGGSIFGRYGFSDVLTVFLALDTEVELFKAGRIPLSEFVALKKDRDLLVRLIVKKKPLRSAYLSMRNSATDFPVLTCAVSQIDGIFQSSIGARPGPAVVVKDQEGILSGGITEETAAAFGEYVAKSIRTGTNLRGSAAYRKHLTKILTTRGVLELASQS